jgi:hypothetical protein
MGRQGGAYISRSPGRLAKNASKDAKAAMTPERGMGDSSVSSSSVMELRTCKNAPSDTDREKLDLDGTRSIMELRDASLKIIRI